MHRVCTISSGKWGEEKEEQEGIKRRREERRGESRAGSHTHACVARQG